MSTSKTTVPYACMGELIDLDQYPMADCRGDAGRNFVQKCRTTLRETGICNLPGFLRPEAAAAMAKQGLDLLPKSYRDVSQHNVYFTGEGVDVPRDHPDCFSQRLAANTIPYDLIQSGSALHRLYNWAPLREFVAGVLDQEKLYLHADPMGAMIIFIYREGDELGWHFDHADFVTTLVLQEPEGGGAFEYVKDLRQPGNENHPGVKSVLAGQHEGVVQAPGGAGTLSLFVGQNSIHRVTPIKGTQPRVIAVLSYEREPDVHFTDQERMRFYGRTVLAS